MVVVVLLDKLLAVETQGKRRTHREIWGLLDLVMQLQAKSSMSQHREPGDGQNIVFVPSENHDSSWQILDYEGEGTTQVSSCRCPWTGRNAWSVPDLGPWEKEREELGIGHRYNQRCVGHVNPNEDQSLSPPPPPGPQAFDRHILRAPVPRWYRTPTNIAKYSGE